MIPSASPERTELQRSSLASVAPLAPSTCCLCETAAGIRLCCKLDPLAELAKVLLYLEKNVNKVEKKVSVAKGQREKRSGRSGRGILEEESGGHCGQQGASVLEP